MVNLLLSPALLRAGPEERRWLDPKRNRSARSPRKSGGC